MKILVKQSEKKILAMLLRAGTFISFPYSVTRTYSVKHPGEKFALTEFRESTYKSLVNKGYIDAQRKITELGKQAAISKWLEIPDKEEAEGIREHKWENGYNKVSVKCTHCECIKIAGMYREKGGKEYLEYEPPCIKKMPDKEAGKNG